jgi:hypothetical protein
MAIIILLSEGLFQPGYFMSSSFLHWQSSLAPPEFLDGHELDLILNYTTGDKGIERQLLLTERGR